MIYYYLKTSDEASMWTALSDAGLAVQENGEWQFTGDSLDMIGSIYAPTGNTLTDQKNNEYPEMQALDGYHANLISRTELTNLPTINAPATPYRKWAGQE